MATCSQSGQEFIRDAFNPTVGVLVSDDAERIAAKNDLSFVELLRPFCQLTNEVRIRDPVNPTIIIPIKKWKIRMIDLRSQMPPQQLISRLLSEIVSKTLDGTVDMESVMTSGNTFDAATPWFEAYRQAFFQLLKPTDHEFIRHILACIIVVSSHHSDPMSAFTTLSSEQSKLQQSGDTSNPYIRWFSTNTFKYFVLLHDTNSGDGAKADAIYQSMSSVYGSNACYLLRVNSKSASEAAAPDPWENYYYPFSAETFDIDDNDDAFELESIPQIPVANADENEEQILNELEQAEKLAEELHSSPVMSFQDPLTSMHYDNTLVDISNEVDDLGPLKPESNFHSNNTSHASLNDKSIKSNKYKECLQQFTFSFQKPLANGNQSYRPKGQLLAEKDHASLASFLHDFATRGLLPHMEKLMRIISEQNLSRKGLHRSLFSATKKWFGGNKGAGGKLGSGLGAGLSYPIDSPELNHRKLGDLAFLVQYYDLAYNCYHTAKREFNNDHAWAYFAGALEMAAISAFMQGNQKNYPVHYFEACISTYLNTCRMHEYATRSCLMSTEALKSKRMYADAAFEFIKLTSEDADLRSALLLEQAAHCYLHNTPPMMRKYAFHMILAGYRFSKAVQRKHTLRCNAIALRVYENKGWHLAEDHVNFIAGRQSFSLGFLGDAAHAFKELLYESRQQPAHQLLHLKEYLTMTAKRNDAEKSKDGQVIDLPLPLVDCQSTRLLLSAPDIDTSGLQYNAIGSSDATRTRTINAGMHVFRTRHTRTFIKRWADLERATVECINRTVPYSWKPYTPCLNAVTNNSDHPLCVCGEMMIVELLLCNPLLVPIQLKDIYLLWEFTGDDSQTSSNRDGNDPKSKACITNEEIQDMVIKGQERKPVCLRLTPHQVGHVNIFGVAYTLNTTDADKPNPSEALTGRDGVSYNTLNPLLGIRGQKLLQIQGPRLNSTKQERSGVLYGKDLRLQPRVIAEMPLLQVSMVNFPITILCGEVQSALFVMKNIGRKPLRNLHISCNMYQFFLVANSSISDRTPTVDSESNSTFLKLDSDAVPKLASKIDLPGGELLPGAELEVNIFIRGLPTPGVHELDFLFYYEPDEPNSNLKYRILQQMVRLQTLSTLTLSASVAGAETVMRDIKTTGDASSSSSGRELILTLKVENRAQGSSVPRCVEFDLTRILAVSPNWKLCHLYNQSKDALHLRPGESSVLHFAIIKQEPNGNARIVSWKQISEIPETDFVLPSTDFLLRADYFDPAGASYAEGIGIVLQWQTSYIDDSCVRHSILGQTNDLVCGTSGQLSRVLLLSMSDDDSTPSPLTVTSTDSEETAPLDVSYVDMHLRHCHVVTCDFDAQGVCCFDVEVILRNRGHAMTRVQLSANSISLHRSDRLLTDPEKEQVVVDSNALNYSARGDMTSIQKSAMWTGPTKITLELDPRSSHVATFKAMALKCGMYDVNCFEAAALDRGFDVRWISSGPSIVCVRPEQSTLEDS